MSSEDQVPCGGVHPDDADVMSTAVSRSPSTWTMVSAPEDTSRTSPLALVKAETTWKAWLPASDRLASITLRSTLSCPCTNWNTSSRVVAVTPLSSRDVYRTQSR